MRIPVGWGLVNAPLLERVTQGDPVAIVYSLVLSITIIVVLYRMLTGKWPKIKKWRI